METKVMIEIGRKANKDVDVVSTLLLSVSLSKPSLAVNNNKTDNITLGTVSQYRDDWLVDNRNSLGSVFSY